MDSPLAAIARLIRDTDDFLVASHFNPDGDAIGGIAAVGHILKALGKRFTLYNVSGLPERYEWLNLPAPVTSDVPNPLPAWTLVLDCGALERVGEELASRLDPQRTLVIDHHLSNEGFGPVSWVDTTEPATAGMIAKLARELGVPLTGDLAEAVYLGVAEDTGFFTFGSTTPETLELIAELYRLGLRPGEINPRIQNQWTPNRLRLWSAVMATLELHHDGRMALLRVTDEMFKRTETTAEDCEGLVNFARKLRGVRMAVLLREKAPGSWKFSLRSHGDDNVQTVAATFGGGGHKNASGGEIEADQDTAAGRLLAAIGEALNA